MRKSLIFALLIASAGRAQAQSGPELKQGTRVRVTAPVLGEAAVVGEVARLSGDTLVVARIGDGFHQAVTFTSLTQLEVSRGNPGAKVGFAVGAIVGVIGAKAVVATLQDSGEDSCHGFECMEGIEVEVFNEILVTCLAVGAGVVIGGLLGGAVGSSLSTERWEPIPLQDLELTVTTEGGVGVALSLPARF
ncbi:MAG: hypothetical protein PVG79_15525 [Gemmatimonadales bacterium]